MPGGAAAAVEVIAARAGRLDAVVTWFKLHLDPGGGGEPAISLSTAPAESLVDGNSCWEQAISGFGRMVVSAKEVPIILVILLLSG